MKIGSLVAVLTLTLAGALAGCLGTTKDCVSSGSDDFRGQELRVLDHGAWDSAYAFVKPLFENETGARLTQVRGEDAGGALRMAIDSRGNPVADVLYGVDNALIAEASRTDVFEPYASPRLSAINGSVIRVDDFRFNGFLLATPVDHGYIGVNYDAEYLKLNETERPRTLRDLAKPEWASEFVVEDPRLSSPGLGFLIATVATFGESGNYTYLDYWRDLLRNDVLVARDWTEAYVVHFSAGYGQYSEGFAGDRKIVVSYTTSPAAEAYYGELESPPSVSLEPANGVFHQIEAVAILRCTDKLPLAKAFIDLLLGPEFQNETAAQMAVYPVVKDATVPEKFRTNATDPSRLTPAPYSSAGLQMRLDTWLDRWTEVYQAERA